MTFIIVLLLFFLILAAILLIFQIKTAHSFWSNYHKSIPEMQFMGFYNEETDL